MCSQFLILCSTLRLRNKNNQLNNLCRGICSLTATFWSLRLVPESNLREQALKVSNCGRRSCDVITTDLYLNKVRDTESSCVFPQFRDYLFSRFTRQQTSKHLHIDVCVFTVFLRRFSKEKAYQITCQWVTNIMQTQRLQGYNALYCRLIFFRLRNCP